MTSEGAARATVALERVQGDVGVAVRRALEAAEWTRAVPKGRDVALKVNLGWDLFIPGSITSPLFAEALIQAIRGHVGTIYQAHNGVYLGRSPGRRSSCRGFEKID